MTKQEYEAKLIQIKDLTEEVYRRRCINCDELWEGLCRKHGAIPGDFIYTENDCGQYHYRIPF